MRLAHPVLVAALLVPAAADAACDPGEAILALRDGGPTSGTPRVAAAELFAERANMALEGKLCVTLALGADGHSDETALAGFGAESYQLAAVDASTLGRFDPAYSVYDLPFLFSGIEAVLAFNAEEGGQVLLGPVGEQDAVAIGPCRAGQRLRLRLRRARPDPHRARCRPCARRDLASARPAVVRPEPASRRRAVRHPTVIEPSSG